MTDRTLADMQKDFDNAGTGKSIDDAPWPSGVSVIPLPNH
jgi:hypothetical protein